MIKKQTGEIMQAIADCYPQFEITQSKVDFWHKTLVDYEFEQVEASLLVYVRGNDYPPKINQLIRGISKQNESYNVPNKEQTMTKLKEFEEQINEAAKTSPTKEQIQEILLKTAGEIFVEAKNKRRKKR